VTDTTLPGNPEAEAALLGRLLLDPRQITLVAGKLQAVDFLSDGNREIYEAMLSLSQASRVVDVTTLSAELGDPDLVNNLAREVGPGHHAPVEEYVSIIRDSAFRRRVIGTLDGVIRRAYDPERDRASLLADLQDAVSRVSQGMSSGRLVSPSEAVDAYLRELTEMAAGRNNGVAYGIKALDDLIQPAQGGDMIVLAARPSVGKTALAEVVGDVWAALRPPVLFCSLEMSLKQLLNRMVSRASGIDAMKLVRGQIGGNDLELAETTAEARRGVGVWYLDDPVATTSIVRSEAARVRQMAGGLGAIVVDYLQLLKDPGDNEVQRVTRISRNVKAIAREFDVPVLVLSQLSRAVESREDRHPKLHDLRESGAIEQDADVVLGMFRELGTSELDVDVLKNRFGPLGRVALDFDPTTLAFRDPMQAMIARGASFA
jgi:replicative DNA helicase